MVFDMAPPIWAWILSCHDWITVDFDDAWATLAIVSVMTVVPCRKSLVVVDWRVIDETGGVIVDLVVRTALAFATLDITSIVAVSKRLLDPKWNHCDTDEEPWVNQSFNLLVVVVVLLDVHRTKESSCRSILLIPRGTLTLWIQRSTRILIMNTSELEQ